MFIVLAQVLPDNTTRASLMAKKSKKDKHLHCHKVTDARYLQRVRLTICYLLRENLSLPVNPDNLDNPQPLTKVDAVSTLYNVINGSAG